MISGHPLNGRSNVDFASRMPESLRSDGACGAVH
jgi:hypothetical protein